MGAQFLQKRLSYKASFDFGEDDLTYSFDNSRVKTGSSVAYHKIPGRTGYREIRMWWLGYAAVFTAAFGIISASHFWAANDMAMVAGIMFASALMFLCACLVALIQRHGGMTSISLDPPLFILHDGQQDAILEEIRKRRTEMMRQKLAQVDFSRPYFEEARKFKWLKEEEIISEQEYRNARQKISAMRDKSGMPPVSPGRMN